jgi:hypothetical protein
MRRRSVVWTITRVALLYVLPGAVCGSALAIASPNEPAREPARATPAPIEAALIIGAPARLDAMASRLTGHRFRRGDHVLILEDVAGAGRPWVGLVDSRCGELWLDTAVRSFRLTGPLARLRIAGPGYLVWATGTIPSASAEAIEARPAEARTDGPSASLGLERLGVLAAPAELPPPFAPAPVPPPCR